MNLGMNILNAVGPILARSKALERWQGARTGVAEPADIPPWLNYTLMVMTAVLVAMILTSLAVWVFRRWLGKIALPPALRPQKRHSAGGSLAAADIDLLTRLFRKSGFIRPNLEFTFRYGLNAGVANYLASDDHADLPADQRQEIEERIEKLQKQFGAGPEDSGSVVLTTRDIPVGARIMVSHGGPRGDFDVIVLENSAMGLRVLPPFATDMANDSHWILRYFDGAKVWGFHSSVIGRNENELLLAHTGQMEVINIRRFARVPVNLSAHISRFSFRQMSGTDSPPALEFVPAEVVEIGGPGLQLRTALSLRVDERILILLDFGKNGRIQTIGKIRREIPSALRTTRNGYGVELVGLNPSQAAELMHLTNSVAIRLHKEQEEKKKEKESSEAAPEQEPAATAV